MPTFQASTAGPAAVPSFADLMTRGDDAVWRSRTLIIEARCLTAQSRAKAMFEANQPELECSDAPGSIASNPG
jgi:hypothetical protein